VANDNNGLAGNAGRPIGNVAVGPSNGAGNHPLIRGKILFGSHVDQHRRVRRADQPDKFFRRYRCVG
jgi:hypothetical protein